jgi:glycerol-3-phosphate acyltransferase PlsX
MKIAVDAMGGDLAPDAAIQATIEYAKQHSDVSLLLVGQEDVLGQKAAGRLPRNVSIVHAPSVIGSGEEPVRAVRRKQDSSMVVAAKLVKDGSAQGMISAGNTGALVASGLLVLGRLEGIHRPALAPVLPTFNGKGVLLLDAGATMDAGPDNLLQYAFMGTAYSKYVLGVPNPRVGLVNVGAEDSKGNALVKEAFNLLKGSTLNFVGNVEARELLDGQVDVVVCDGFVGNVVLKLTEGVGLGIFQALKTALTGSVTSKLAAAVLKPSLRAFKDKFDYAEYGGAPFLGVSGGCIKAHGSSNDRAWYTAISQAVRFAQEDLLHKIQQDLDVGQQS